MLTITAAMEQAATEYGPVYRLRSGETGWGFRTYDAKRQAWREPGRLMGYYPACIHRAECIAAAAAVLILADRGMPKHQADLLAVRLAEHGAGSVPQRVRQILRAAQAAGH